MTGQTRRQFLKSLSLTAAAIGAHAALPGCANAQTTKRPERRPNVVLVMTDDQGYGDLSCHGHPILKTPNLDSLHAQSTRLTNFHVGPTCSPTRASLMTGHYCNATGVWHTVMGRSLLRRDEVTMADVFRANGYRTAIFGKWHLGDNYPFRPQDRGFDETLIHKGGGIGNTQDYWGNKYFDDTYFRNGKPEKFTGYCTDIWFDEASKFIEANKDRPFFCYVPTNAPHGPFKVPEKYSKPYMGKNYKGKHLKYLFLGMIASIDENMGRFMARLKELDLERDTIFIFTTDNGSSGGRYSAGLQGRKGSEYDGGHRVPFFIRWPAAGIDGGVDIDRLTAHIDLLPTLIELCELKGPEGVRFDGRSIAGLLKGRDKNWPDRTIITDSQRMEFPKKWHKSAVMTDNWRLVNGEKLYDANNDRGQRKDIAEQNPQVVVKLRKAYDDWWSQTSKRFHDYCRIVLGSPEENPTTLTSHDWHAHGPWNQDQVRRGSPTNSYWVVEVAREGRYEIALRRWPKEANAPITAAIGKGVAISATEARLKIAGHNVTKPIGEKASAVTFELNLKAGPTRLQTWLTDNAGQSRGAYYVEVKRLGHLKV